MSTEDFGCELMVPAQHDDAHTAVYLADVDREFLGLSLTKHNGTMMRRVAVELRDVEQIAKLRDSLDAFLARKNVAQ